MIYKLSNAVERKVIETEFGIPFKYPHIYSPSLIINGFNETNLSVVTMESPYEINYAIWGLMPQNFKEDWHIFQNNANTLNVGLRELENIQWMRESLEERRCLIIVSGFYTHLLHNGAHPPTICTSLHKNRSCWPASIMYWKMASIAAH